MMKIPLYIIFLISCVALRAQDTLTEIGLKNQIVALERNVENLKTEITVLNDVNGRILDSVYWVIGIIATVFIGLGLFNYISTTRLNKVKFDEISANLKSEFNTMEIKVQQKNDTLMETSLNKFKELDESLTKNISSQLNSKVNDLNNRLGIMQAQINANSISHYEKNSSFDQTTYFDKYDKLANLREILNLEIQMVEMDKYSSLEYRVDFHRRLDSIHEYIKKTEIELYDKEQLVKVLDKLPEKFSEAVQIIKNDIKINRISRM